MKNGLGSYGVGVYRHPLALQSPELVQTANYHVWAPGVPRSLSGCAACAGLGATEETPFWLLAVAFGVAAWVTLRVLK